LERWKQSQLSAFSGDPQRDPLTLGPKLYIVHKGEDKNVRIGNHTVPLSFLAGLFCDFLGGLSTRALKRKYAAKGHGFSHVTYWQWILALSHLLYIFCLQMMPAVGSLWYADEMKVGKLWLVFVSDKATRFILAARVILSRSSTRLRKVLTIARTVAGKHPGELRTDGCTGYREASDGVFGKGVHKWKTKQEAGGLSFTNFQEGTQRQPRARIDCMTAFHGTLDEDNDLAEGYLVYHNFIAASPSLTTQLSTHPSLKGMPGSLEQTPAEASAIRPLGDDPALTLLWNAVGDSGRILLRHHQPKKRRTQQPMTLHRWVEIPITCTTPKKSRRRTRDRKTYRDLKLTRWSRRPRQVTALASTTASANSA